MKPIVLFLSAICIALMGVLAIYYDPRLWGAVAVIVFSLVFGYVPKLRKWCALFGVIVLLPAGFASIIHEIYSDGILSFLAGSGAGGIGAGLGAYIAYKGRAGMRNSGLPSFPGDESKTNEELEAEDDFKFKPPFEVLNRIFYKHRNLHRGK